MLPSQSDKPSLKSLKKYEQKTNTNGFIESCTKQDATNKLKQGSPKKIVKRFFSEEMMPCV
jgi:hypothetical protein